MGNNNFCCNSNKEKSSFTESLKFETSLSLHYINKICKQIISNLTPFNALLETALLYFHKIFLLIYHNFHYPIQRGENVIVPLKKFSELRIVLQNAEKIITEHYNSNPKENNINFLTISIDKIIFILKDMKSNDIIIFFAQYQKKRESGILNDNYLNEFSETLERIDQIYKNIDEKMNENNKKHFNLGIAAEFWFENFDNKEIINIEIFIDCFKNFIEQVDKIILSDNELRIIKELLCKNEENVSIENWSLFYENKWIVWKQDILTSSTFNIEN